MFKYLFSLSSFRILRQGDRMKEIVCVRQDSSKDAYLTKLLNEANLVAKFFLWDDLVFTGNLAMLLMLDEEHVDALIDVIEAHEMKIIIVLNSRRDFKLVSKFKNHFDKIFGFVDISQEIDYNTPLLKNYINLNFSAHAISLNELARDLEKIHDFTKSQLVQIKDLHEKLVKVRVDSLKGVSITSKFMAGEKSGGEFFDMIQTDHNFLFIQAGSDSYILSSLLISEMENLKTSFSTIDIIEQIEQFKKTIKYHAQETGAELNYCIINIDTKTLLAECQFEGSGLLYFQNNLIDFSRPVKFKMKPLNKLHLLSSGALKNLKELNPNFSVESFYQKNKDLQNNELINEFFFEVSRNKSGKFLVYDALMTVIEVEQKVLYKL